MSTEGAVGPEQQAGKELHREFVGMLFALAIAEVAVAAAAVASAAAKHELAFTTVLPAYTHLLLAAIVISTSWVGWGRSKVSLSFIENVFSPAFFELLLDVWLVTAYFFLAKGVEPVEVDGSAQFEPSLRNEAFWIMVIFCTYAIWDAWTKLVDSRGLHANLRTYSERGWASLACAGLAGLAVLALRGNANTSAPQAVLGDFSLLSLVFLFRAMKLRNLRELAHAQWILIALLAASFVLLLAITVAWPSIAAGVASD